MTKVKQTTIDGLALPVAAGGGTARERDAPAFRVPVRRSLRMHPLVALSAGLLVLAALLAFALTRKPVYRAESRVYVEPIPTRVLGDTGSGNYDMARYESFLQEQMETVTRPDILLAAVRSMPAGVWQRPGETAESAATRLGASLKTERVSTSYQLAISVGAPTAESAAAATNAVTRAYLDAGQKDAKALSAGRLELLTEERQRIADEMQTMRAEQTSLGASLGVANPNGVGGDAYDAELQNVRGELASARQAHDLAAAQLSALTGPGGQRAAGTVATAEEAVANDPAVSSMRIAINQRRAALIAQMNGMKPANPVYQDDQQELTRLDGQLAGMSTNLQAQVEQRMEAKLRQDLQRTGDVEARLNAEVSHDTALATNAGPKLQRSAELTADLARLQTRYAAVDDSVRGLQLETSGPGMAHLAVAASVPSTPEPSKSRLVLILALPLALLVGIAAAVLARNMDHHVYTPGDVEEALGFAPVGVLPAPSEVSDSVTEEYLLRVAAGLEAAYRGAAARSFVFTAASAGTAISSEVEAVHRKLKELGFAVTILAADQVMRPAGEAQVTPGEREGFASAHLEELKAEFDLLLIDAHPLLHSAQAEYAVRSSDAVILVVESGVTTLRELGLAASLLRRLQASGVGTLLQGVTLRNGEPEFRRSIEVLERRELPGKAIYTNASPDRAQAQPEAAQPTMPVPAEEPPVVNEPAVTNEHAVACEPVIVSDPFVLKESADARPDVRESIVNQPVVASAPASESPKLVEIATVIPEAASPAAKARLQLVSAVPEEAEDLPKLGMFTRFLQNFRKQEAVSIVPADDEAEVQEVAQQNPPVGQMSNPGSSLTAAEPASYSPVDSISTPVEVSPAVEQDKEKTATLDAPTILPEKAPVPELLHVSVPAEESLPLVVELTSPPAAKIHPSQEKSESAPVRRWGPVPERYTPERETVTRPEPSSAPPVDSEPEQQQPAAAARSPRVTAGPNVPRPILFEERAYSKVSGPRESGALVKTFAAPEAARPAHDSESFAREREPRPATRKAPNEWQTKDEVLPARSIAPVSFPPAVRRSSESRMWSEETGKSVRSWAALSRFESPHDDETDEDLARRRAARSGVRA